MSNILAAVELLDLGIINFTGLNYLKAVENPDVASLGSGNLIAGVELPDSADIEIASRSIHLLVTEALDVGSFDIKVGIGIEINAIEASDTSLITGRSEVIISVAATEQFDQGSFDALTGIVGSLSAVESGDVATLSISPDTFLEIAGVEASDSVFIHGLEIPVTFIRKAVVMHIFNFAVTEYKNYNFNSLLHFNGAFIGMNEQGVFMLDGNNDLGELIQARIKSGVEDFSKDGAVTIPREAWLAYRSDNGMLLDVRGDESVDLPTMVFSKVAAGIRECRAKLGRGIKQRFFQWDLKNQNGSDFSLQSLRILGDIIKRKTR